MNSNPLPRWTNAALGAWLFMSVFMWEHTPAQFTNAWVVGLLTLFVALMATRVDNLRYFNALLGGWLFISAWTLPALSVATVWNNLVVAVVIVVAAVVPQKPVPGAHDHANHPPIRMP